MQHYQTIIIGGGQSGLAAGYFLKQYHLDFVILDANEQIGGSWQHYYDSLKLFSPARYSELPGLHFSGDRDREPTRLEVIDYLRTYAHEHDLPIRSGVRVSAVEQDGEQFVVRAVGGGVYTADTVIAASGPFNTPYMPTLPGVEQFGGGTLHAFNYRSPEPYADQHVVVIGSRDSAMQIAVELAQVARVSMAVRHALKFVPKRVLGQSLFFWLHDTGYDQLPLGLFRELTTSPKIIGKEPYQTALANGNPTPKPMFTTYTPEGVVWGNGEVEAVDTVIYATGYRPGLDYLAPLGALDVDGRALQRNGISRTVSGLYYVGLFGQRSHASATLRGVGHDAEVIARQVARYMQKRLVMGAASPVAHGS